MQAKGSLSLSGPWDSPELFIGISGISLPSDLFELGHGVTLSKTYAHTFSHPMMAIKPPANEGDRRYWKATQYSRRS